MINKINKVAFSLIWFTVLATGFLPSASAAMNPQKGGWKQHRFTTQEDQFIMTQHAQGKSFRDIAYALHINPRSVSLRWYYQLNPNINRADFTPEEDERLLQLVRREGNKWVWLVRSFPGRTRFQLKLRYNKLLKDSLRKSYFTPAEDERLFQLVRRYGNKWSYLVQFFPGRTRLQLKHRYNSVLSRFSCIEDLRNHTNNANQQTLLTSITPTKINMPLNLITPEVLSIPHLSQLTEIIPDPELIEIIPSPEPEPEPKV